MFLWLCSLAYSLPTVSDHIDQARESMLHGDQETTIAITKKLLRNKKVYGTQKDISRYLLATALEHKGSYLLAAEQYQKIYWGGRALKKEALFARAKNLSLGLDHKGVLSSCHTFRKKWSDHDYADTCLLLIGEAHGYIGNISKMRYYFQDYLSKHVDSPKAESIHAKQALFAHKHNRRGAKEELRYLYLNHSYPSTAAQIRNALTEEELIPQNLNEKSQYIWSLIRSGFLDEAWEHTQNLIEQAKTTPQTDAWIEENLTQIAWYTRSYDTYIERRKAEYTSNPTGLIAWKIFHAYARSGQWKEAAEWGDDMLVKYKRRGRWAGAKDDVARAHMFQRNYGRAAELWSQKRGKLAQFNQAFCTYMNGAYKESIPLFEKLADREDAWGVASNYWIGKSKEKLGENPKQNFEYVRTHDTVHWYRLLLDQKTELPNPQTIIFDGQWKQKSLTTKKALDGVLHAKIIPIPQPKEIDKTLLAHNDTDARFDWSAAESKKRISAPKQPVFSANAHPFAGSQLPNSYDNLPFLSDEELEDGFTELIARKGKTLPVLKEIYALAKAGNYPIAAHKLNSLYDKWKSNKGGVSIQNMMQKELEWLPHMIFVRSHHHVMRLTMLSASSSEASSAMQEINFPLVHQHYVWSLSKEYNIDPFLIHSILRAESTYREFIVSWAGAIGYVQVMPKTGAKVAHLLNEETYSPEDLEQPKTNLRYGSFYFSRLMERFDQSYPFAVGSYNGGPHNMSRWYKNLNGHVQMDEFVEHVSFDETRRYIKKVCGFYSQYLEYHHPNAKVRLPLPPGEDDASVIDF